MKHAGHSEFCMRSHHVTKIEIPFLTQILCKGEEGEKVWVMQNFDKTMVIIADCMIYLLTYLPTVNF